MGCKSMADQQSLLLPSRHRAPSNKGDSRYMDACDGNLLRVTFTDNSVVAV